MRASLIDRLKPAPRDDLITKRSGRVLRQTNAQTRISPFVRGVPADCRYAAAGRGSGRMLVFNAGCADWPVVRDRYAGPWTAARLTCLVVGNFFDG